MKVRSEKTVWLVLVVCAALIVAAMFWLTHGVVAAEKERSLAESRADLEGRVRLSLWRMDAAAAAVTIEENQRLTAVGEGIPENPLVKLRFRVAPGGAVSALSQDADEALSELKTLISAESDFADRFQLMCSAVHEGVGQWAANEVVAQTTQQAEAPRQSSTYQVQRSMKEKAVRAKSVNATVGKVGLAQQVVAPNQGNPMAASYGAYQPAWIGDQAFLLREVRSATPLVTIEGAWLNAEGFRSMLLEEVVDILPHASLVPADTDEQKSSPMTLASFPWKLISGEQAVAAADVSRSVVASLATGWCAVLIALCAGLFLVRGIILLSERRASFVSAVTHELRTPLTTFRLYSDMLDSGAVVDEEKRSGYFRTLRCEADRLSHLVENVLAFSRIEKKGKTPKLEALELSKLLEGMRERFEERLATSGMTLVMNTEGFPSVRGDAAAIEHILFNLIDNAAKYAAGAENKEVEVSATAENGQVNLTVRDHGPGIRSNESREIFRAFHKSAHEAAESKPGVGLGLALSRRLALSMGGRLEYRTSEQGACFVFVLART